MIRGIQANLIVFLVTLSLSVLADETKEHTEGTSEGGRTYSSKDFQISPCGKKLPNSEDKILAANQIYNIEVEFIDGKWMPVKGGKCRTVVTTSGISVKDGKKDLNTKVEIKGLVARRVSDEQRSNWELYSTFTPAMTGSTDDARKDLRLLFSFMNEGDNLTFPLDCDYQKMKIVRLFVCKDDTEDPRTCKKVPVWYYTYKGGVVTPLLAAAREGGWQKVIDLLEPRDGKEVKSAELLTYKEVQDALMASERPELAQGEKTDEIADPNDTNSDVTPKVDTNTASVTETSSAPTTTEVASATTSDDDSISDLELLSNSYDPASTEGASSVKRSEEPPAADVPTPDKNDIEDKSERTLSSTVPGSILDLRDSAACDGQCILSRQIPSIEEFTEAK